MIFLQHRGYAAPNLLIYLLHNAVFENKPLIITETLTLDCCGLMFSQAMTGGGGWPMSVWLTPDLKPFVGATYFPPEDQAGRPGFRTILNHISKQVGLSVLKYCQGFMNLFAPRVPIVIGLMQK